MKEWRCVKCDRVLGEYEGRGAVISHTCKRCGHPNILDLRDAD